MENHDTGRRSFLDILTQTASQRMDLTTTASTLLKSTYSSQPSSTTTTATTTTTYSQTLSRIFSTLLSSTVKENSHDVTEIVSPSTGLAVDVGGGGLADVNTPLNAPEPSLDPVTDPPLLGDSGGISDLGWIIPTAIVCIAAMIGLAFALYFGVRKLELRMLNWCYRNCACCCRPGGGEGGRLLRGEQYDTLSEETNRKGRKETVRLRDFRERSPSYGVTRGSSAKARSPQRDFNPFDDDS